MKVGIIGLGRMGAGIGYRLMKAGFEVYGYDPSPDAQKNAQEENIIIAASLEDLATQAETLWFLVPQGPLIDQIITQIQSKLKKSAILIDAGNSKFTDSERRAKALSNQGISFLDCGTSGGIHGKENGYSLMIGGEKKYMISCDHNSKQSQPPVGTGIWDFLVQVIL